MVSCRVGCAASVACCFNAGSCVEAAAAVLQPARLIMFCCSCFLKHQQQSCLALACLCSSWFWVNGFLPGQQQVAFAAVCCSSSSRRHRPAGSTHCAVNRLQSTCSRSEVAFLHVQAYACCKRMLVGAPIGCCVTNFEMHRFWPFLVSHRVSHRDGWVLLT